MDISILYANFKFKHIWTLRRKDKRDVHGEYILFCFDTLKLYYFAYLSLPPSISETSYKYQNVFYSFPFGRMVCHFLGGNMRGGG